VRRNYLIRTCVYIIKNGAEHMANTDTVTKAEFVDEVAKITKLSKKDTSATLDAVLEVITKSLKKGKKVSFIGFGSFEVRKRAARNGVNPATKQPIKIPAAKVAAFKAGAKLKDAVK